MKKAPLSRKITNKFIIILFQVCSILNELNNGCFNIRYGSKNLDNEQKICAQNGFSKFSVSSSTVEFKCQNNTATYRAEITCTEAANQKEADEMTNALIGCNQKFQNVEKTIEYRCLNSLELEKLSKIQELEIFQNLPKMSISKNSDFKNIDFKKIRLPKI